MNDQRRKRFKIVPEMEGATARWYTRQRGAGSQMDAYREQAVALTDGLPSAAHVLEVAPGPGYLAVEIARLGRFRVTGLDISRTFVGIATEQARQAAVSVEFRHGDVAGMPFDAESFDLIICQAAFKNFVRPDTALDEMHRVLRPGGVAVIQDLRREVSGAELDREVEQMGLTRINTFVTKSTLAMLRRRAHSRSDVERLAAESPFRTCGIRIDGIGMEVRLSKQAVA